MIHTSYYAKYRGNSACAISVTYPNGFKGVTCQALNPPKSLLAWYKHWEETYKKELDENGDVNKYRTSMKLLQQNYTEQYREDILNKIDVHSVAKALDGKVLLCWEKSGRFCHRHIVAQWLRDSGYECEELIYSSELKGRKRK